MVTRERSRPEKVKKYVEGLLSGLVEKQHLYYHNIEHTLDVYDACKKLAEDEPLNHRSMEILLTAALLHDVGYLEQYDANEPRGAERARKILPSFGYAEDEIEQIAGLILATSMPQKPQGVLEEIICDADLSNLGSVSFMRKSNNLRKEWKAVKNNNYTEREWLELQIKFLSEHKYHTDTARELYDETKQENIRKLRAMLEKHQ